MWIPEKITINPTLAEPGNLISYESRQSKNREEVTGGEERETGLFDWISLSNRRKGNSNKMNGPPFLFMTVFTGRGPRKNTPTFSPVVFRVTCRETQMPHSSRDPRPQNHWCQPNRVSFSTTLSDQLSDIETSTDSSLAGARRGLLLKRLLWKTHRVSFRAAFLHVLTSHIIEDVKCPPASPPFNLSAQPAVCLTTIKSTASSPCAVLEALWMESSSGILLGCWVSQ